MLFLKGWGSRIQTEIQCLEQGKILYHASTVVCSSPYPSPFYTPWQLPTNVHLRYCPLGLQAKDRAMSHLVSPSNNHFVTHNGLSVSVY